MEQILLKGAFVEQVLYVLICVPIAASVGTVTGRLLSLLMLSSEGAIQYLFRFLSQFLIVFVFLYLALEWDYLSFDWVVLWVAFIIPFVAIHGQSVQRIQTMRETKEKL